MKNEFGRSMVEMLGVLAIMGVVGLTGIKMYTVAMNYIKMNELKSWLTRMELAFYETCFYKDNAACGAAGGVQYAQSRTILCASTFGGADFCDTTNAAAYATLKIIPNIQWTSRASKTAWTVYFKNLSESQCEQFFNMELPKNVAVVGTNNTNFATTTKPAQLTSQQKQYGISQCKRGVKENASFGGTFLMTFSMQ